ncbi:family 20 glycosylhydrolase [uncultured Alistipes sp.]|uniref:family 20 glycosylhydrolase n=1 Tax=uncultured Alistipes sp. TaxID=538949 RepID=UPI00338FBB26
MPGIEIEGYPRLASVGGVGSRRDSGTPARFYAREEIRDIVTYAGARFGPDAARSEGL